MLQAIVLGVVQGLTEFLPVSSSGHLVLFQQFMEIHGDELFFDLALHLGTLLPVLWVFRDDIVRMLRAPFAEEGPLTQRPGLRLMAWILVGSVPTAAIGLALEAVFEQPFSTPAALTVSFSITGALLYATGRVPHGEKTEIDTTWWHAVVIGIAQGLAITPGISRSGTTIAVALFLGMSRNYAARYSFLLSIPAIAGGFLLKLRDVSLDDVDLAATAVGMGAALVSGYFALVLLLKLVKTGDFSKFCWYAWLAAIASLVITLTG